MEWASWWNWHLASFMLIVELASCQFHAYCGTGILVELASCQFQYIFERAGCPLYSYSFKDSAMLDRTYPILSLLGHNVLME
ncbi:hypothetical protein [Moorena producens]|uniref:hypothetical protein n=1 Tax=Moorena producens TaxID=1155739 RepID=UPI003C761118